MGALVATASSASAGGIADEPCPTVAGEHTNTCPPGTIGAPYQVRFRENDGSGCGPGRQTFHLDSGALPAGLALAPDGTLSGIPRERGRFQFYVEMREPETDPATCAGKRTQKEFTIWVREPVSIAAAPASPPASEVGVPLRVRLRARGGSGVFAWTSGRGRLPAGLRLRRDGTLAGVPRRAGTYYLELSARDTEARVARWSATLLVAPRLAVRTRRLPAAQLGRTYDVRLSVEGGVAPTQWRLVRGALPRGLRLGPSGRIVGTPLRTGTYRAVARVRDELGVRATATLTLVVSRST